jgi:hypothetical protein
VCRRASVGAGDFTNCTAIDFLIAWEYEMSVCQGVFPGIKMEVPWPRDSMSARSVNEWI